MSTPVTFLKKFPDICTIKSSIQTQRQEEKTNKHGGGRTFRK